MLGNSALAMAQWRIASERPPHLACIAPWEGTADIYREAFLWGGFNENGFWPFLIQMLVGSGLVEDFATMAEDYPLMNAYWEDKIPQFEKIEVPAYVTVGLEPLPSSRCHHGFQAHQLQAEMAARAQGF